MSSLVQSWVIIIATPNNLHSEETENTETTLSNTFSVKKELLHIAFLSCNRFFTWGKIWYYYLWEYQPFMKVSWTLVLGNYFYRWGNDLNNFNSIRFAVFWKQLFGFFLNYLHIHFLDKAWLCTEPTYSHPSSE